MSKETPANKVVKKASKIAMKDIIKPNLSKETLNAEEKLLKTFKRILSVDDENIIDKFWSSRQAEKVYREAIKYHKAKVNAITDEEIEKEFKYEDTSDCEIGAKWFKNRLLNG